MHANLLFISLLLWCAYDRHFVGLFF